MMHLPNELIIAILMRLPVKSLLRFRCVSNKSWFSLISDPHFAKSHFELTAAPTYRLLYLPCYAYASQTRSIDFDTGSASAPLINLHCLMDCYQRKQNDFYMVFIDMEKGIGW